MFSSLGIVLRNIKISSAMHGLVTLSVAVLAYLDWIAGCNLGCLALGSCCSELSSARSRVSAFCRTVTTFSMEVHNSSSSSSISASSCDDRRIIYPPTNKHKLLQSRESSFDKSETEETALGVTTDAVVTIGDKATLEAESEG